MHQSSLFIRREAVFSPCGMYRYVLRRIWDDSLPYVHFNGLNPSKADAYREDNTSTRCIDYAMRWGYGGAYLTNLYAYCATDPEKMKLAEDPIGLETDRWIKDVAAGAGIHVAIWGTHGTFLNRNQAVIELLPKPLYCLALTKDGHPHHTRGLSRELKPQLWIPDQ